MKISFMELNACIRCIKDEYLILSLEELIDLLNENPGFTLTIESEEPIQ